MLPADVSSSDVPVNSAASIGCRLLSEPRIQYYIHKLYRERNSFVFNENAYKYQFYYL